MTILALETSSPRGSLVLWRDGEVMLEREFVTERGHNAALFGPLAEALGEVGGDERPWLVAGRGPGSYTGVRIGIAALVGVGLARSWPALGLGLGASLKGIGAGEGWIAGDARRGEWFVQRHDAGWAREAEWKSADELEELAAREPVFSAEPGWEQGGPGGVRWQAPAARVLAASAVALGEEELERRVAQTLEPVYVREAFITLPKPR